MLALLPTASGKLQAAVVEESETLSSGVMELLWVKKCPAPSKMWQSLNALHLPLSAVWSARFPSLTNAYPAPHLICRIPHWSRWHWRHVDSEKRQSALTLAGFFFFSKIAQRRRADVYRRGGKTCCKQSPNKESIEHRAGDSSPDRESLELMGCTWTADRPSFSVITHSGQQRVVQIYSEGSHLTSTSLSIQEEDNKSILLLSGSLKYKS